jgi:hypothetical protein
MRGAAGSDDVILFGCEVWRMRSPEIEEREVEEGSPPLFATWGRLYAAVVGFLAFLIVVFYLFTKAYQ